LFREWLLSHHAELLARDLTSQVALWFRQTLDSLAITCPSSSSTITGLRPMTSPSALWSTAPQPTEVGQVVSSRQAPELGTLRPALDQPFTFSPWSLSCLRQEPTPTFQSSSGCAIFRPPISTRRLAPSSEVAVFQGFVACLPSRPTRRRSFTLDRHRSHQTGGCPWLLTSDLYHLAITLLLIEFLPLAQVRKHLTSLDLPFGFFTCNP